ncbi:Six-hairpin glycosidase [Aspergillus leporis]|uniref:Six-hairpin glycosidase n=1 Tax=Aspergillus leporis TaxID=41062 RepID=A0A5N5X520_9EURO|nr:Six-hairpin glycosidase [Aspergillus leporis]
MRLLLKFLVFFPIDHVLSSYLPPGVSLPLGEIDLPELFSESTTAKILRTALPERFPDNVPSTGPTTGLYTFSKISAWTSGFFPGSLYALLERSVKYPNHSGITEIDPVDVYSQLFDLSRQWSDPLHQQAFRTNTHDMGFLILPALRRDWELTGNRTSFDSLITAAHSLATRFDARVDAVRSWDSLVNKRHNITNKATNFLVIIDSMCNMDLLYYAGYHTANQTLIDIATTHAHTVRHSIVREDYSTFHCCNIDPLTDKIIFQETVQGYKDWSTWSRGQAWGILGYAQAYQWTKEPLFLETARGLADYFVKRLTTSNHNHPYVPLWDFDTPTVDDILPPRDTSAGLVAANGLLLLHQILQGESPYLDNALRIVSETIDLSMPSDQVVLTVDSGGNIVVPQVSWESILMNATINNNEYSPSPSNNTGLVYADYYFLEFGNRLLEMGFI